VILALDHRLHKLVVDPPGGRVTDPQEAFQRQGRQPGLGLADEIDGQEPHRQGQLGPLKHRPDDQGCLLTAGAALAEPFIAATCAKQAITRNQLTLYADRGSSMTSKPVALLQADLGVTKSHSRPYVSDGNPFSEAHFKTLKYRTDFSERFGCLEDARAHCRAFFHWYNHDHRLPGLGRPPSGTCQSDH
jgi:hypothetical protein